MSGKISPESETTTILPGYGKVLPMSWRSDVAMLEYAGLQTPRRLPWRWVWTATALWAAAMLLEQAADWVIIFYVSKTRGWEIGPASCTDAFIPTIAACAILVGLLVGRNRRGAGSSRLVVGACAVAVASALASIAIWNLEVLPRVAISLNPRDYKYTWEAELILDRLLAVVWPMLVVYFAWRDTPTRRKAGAIIAWGALAVWIVAGAASIAIYHYHDFKHLLPRYWDNTVLPAWWMLGLVTGAIGFALWHSKPPPGVSALLFILGVATSLTMGALDAWYDERLTYLRHWTTLHDFLEFGNLADVAAGLCSTLVLWQIAPIVLMFQATRSPLRQTD